MWGKEKKEEDQRNGGILERRGLEGMYVRTYRKGKGQVNDD